MADLLRSVIWSEQPHNVARIPSRQGLTSRWRIGWPDLAILGFLLTAGGSFWAAYDRTSAGAKFLAITFAIAIYYSLAKSALPGLWKAAILSGALTSVVAGLVVLAGVAGKLPAITVAATPVGRGTLALAALDGDTATGLLAVLLPFQVAAAIYARQQGARWEQVAWISGCLLSAGALLAGNSRGAVVASTLAGGLVLWRLRIARARPMASRTILAVLLGSVLAVVAAIALSGGVAGAWETIQSRLQLAQEGLWLAEDFRLIGGGLGSFPGLYSRYVLIQPNPFFSRSYNLFLDLTIEQGLLALASYLGICVGSLWALAAQRPWLLGSRRVRLIQGAAAASVLTVLTLGWVHDPFSEPLGALFLFLGPGFVASLRRFPDQAPGGPKPNSSGHRLSPIRVGALVMVSVMAIGLWPWHLLPANLWANWGAVRLAQIELEDWPDRRGRIGDGASEMAAVKRWLESSLAWDPFNRTANYRLGLVALDQDDFVRAAEYLERAWAEGEEHRGVRKALGYSYVWLGRLDLAEQMLGPIPEASRELRVYARRWSDRGRPDLAAWAATLSSRLDASG